MRAGARRTGLVAVGLAALAAAVAGCGGGTTTVTVSTPSPPPPSAPPPAPPPGGTVATTLQPPPDTAPVDTTSVDTTSVDTTSVDTTSVDTTETVPTATSETTETVDTSDTSGTEPPPPTVDRPADFPSGGEAFLLERVPQEVADQCTRESDDERSAEAIAGLTCDVTDTLGAKAYYELFRNRAGMEDTYERYRSANDVPVDAGGCVRATAADLPGETAWHFNSTPNTEQGRSMCFRRDRDGSFWVIWTEDRYNAMGFATNKDSYRPVARYFAEVGGLSAGG